MWLEFSRENREHKWFSSKVINIAPVWACVCVRVGVCARVFVRVCVCELGEICLTVVKKELV